jgi:hypothetical protein
MLSVDAGLVASHSKSLESVQVYEYPLKMIQYTINHQDLWFSVTFFIFFAEHFLFADR